MASGIYPGECLMYETAETVRGLLRFCTMMRSIGGVKRSYEEQFLSLSRSAPVIHGVGPEFFGLRITSETFQSARLSAGDSSRQFFRITHVSFPFS